MLNATRVRRHTQYKLQSNRAPLVSFHPLWKMSLTTTTRERVWCCKYHMAAYPTLLSSMWRVNVGRWCAGVVKSVTGAKSDNPEPNSRESMASNAKRKR